MAYFGRGKGIGIGFGTGGRIRFGPRLFRRCYYVPLDNTYVLMQMIASFIILIVCVIAFLLKYESNIIDPIKDIKEIFINVHLIVIGVFLLMNLMISFLSRKESKIVERLILLLIISFLFMLVFVLIRLDWDKTYTKNKFEQICEEQNYFEDGKLNSVIDFYTMSIKTEKEYYISECVNSYNLFKVRTYTLLGIHTLLNILLVCQILKLQKIQTKKQRLEKDEVILFDQEQNIRF